MFIQKIHSFARSLWYKLSPTAHNFTYLKQQLDTVTELVQNTDVMRRSDADELSQTIDAVRSELCGVARRDELLKSEDISNAIQQSGLLHYEEMLGLLQQSGLLHYEEMLELLQQSGLLHYEEMSELLQQSELLRKSDTADIVRQCAELPQITKEYVWNHQMDSAAVEPNTELYNSYKWLETQHLPEFIRTRLAYGATGYELKKLAEKYPDKHIYVLTDLPDYDYPYRAISLDEVPERAKDDAALFIFLYRFDSARWISRTFSRASR